MSIYVDAETPRRQFTVTSPTTEFSFDFNFFQDSDIKVYVDSTLKSLTTHYSVTGEGNDTASNHGGTVTFGSAVDDCTVTIIRDIAIQRTTDFPASGSFQVDSLNTELDTITAVQQELEDDITRTLRLDAEDAAVAMTLPLKASRLGKILGFNSSTGVPEMYVYLTNENTVALDGLTAGTVTESKYVLVDANKDIGSFRNVTLTGELDAGSLDVSGNADIAGTLEADVITVDGTALNEYIADTVGAMVGSNTETGITVTYEDGDNTLDFVIGSGVIATAMLAGDAVTGAKIADDALDSEHYTDGSIDLVHMSANSIDSDQYVDGSIDLVHMSANSVDSDQYVDGSIDLVHMSANSVDSDQYVDGSIDGVHIANDAIDSQHYAADSIDTEHYAAGSVDATALGADCVTGAKIADDALDSEHYIDGSIDTAHIANGAITADKIADGTVVAAEIASNAVTTVKINADAVTGAKIADDAINSEHYTDGSIDTAHIANDQITNALMADDAIDSAQIADGAIDTAHIANLQVTTAKIAADAITAAKIADDVINSEHYAAASIDNEHLADDAVDSDEIAAGAIDLAHMSVNSIDSDQYVDGSIDTVHIADGAITGAKIAAGTVVASDVADDAITTAKILNANVTLAKMAANSIDSTQYVDGSIDTAHYAAGSVDATALGADCVTAAKIGDNVLNSEHYAAASIDNEHLAANSVDSDNYVDGSIDTVHIGADQITSAKIADDQIDSEHIVAGAVDAEHMSANSIDSDQYVDGSIDLVHMSANSVDSDQYVDGSIDTAHVADNAVTLAKMAGLARGKLIYGDASGDPAALTVGGNGTFLKSDGTDVSWGAATVSGLACDDLTVGDSAVTVSTSSGNITVDAQGNNTDIIFKGTDATADITMLTLDGSEAGDATFNRKVIATELDISGDIDVNGTTNLDVVDIDGALTQDGGAVFNEASADVDFRVESNGLTHALFVDGGNDSVLIGMDDVAYAVTNEADHLIVGNPSDAITGMTLVTSATGYSSINFSDANSGDGRLGAYLAYDHNNNVVWLGGRGNGTTLLNIHADGRWEQKGCDSGSGPAMLVFNDGNNANRKGMIIQCGADDAAGTNYAISIDSGNGTGQGSVTFSGGTVTYGPFTAHHEISLPDADKSDGYAYGTLVEIDEIYYCKNQDGTDTERGIRYLVKKSQSAYSRKVLGAYCGDMLEVADEDGTYANNLHQASILGDGHIICNGEKGNIAIGDGICTSSTVGVGMKADKMAMIIGIAQEDTTFSSASETKLVPVQFGVKQFTPWTD
jgi:cytoskeletal protein CcmA (bactofilin family)